MQSPNGKCQVEGLLGHDSVCIYSNGAVSCYDCISADRRWKDTGKRKVYWKHNTFKFHLSATNPIWTCLESNSVLRGEETTKPLSHGVALRFGVNHYGHLQVIKACPEAVTTGSFESLVLVQQEERHETKEVRKI